MTVHTAVVTAPQLFFAIVRMVRGLLAGAIGASVRPSTSVHTSGVAYKGTPGYKFESSGETAINNVSGSRHLKGKQEH